MTATRETEPRADTSAGTDERLAEASNRLLEAFVAVCHAPDDLTVAANANAALHDLERLLP
jgi:hypothetical protein